VRTKNIRLADRFEFDELSRVVGRLLRRQRTVVTDESAPQAGRLNNVLRRKKQSKPRAFTILELLAATALTALLMVAVLHVISSLGRSRAALARQPDGGAWRSDLLDTLRYDLSNATAASFRHGKVTLAGHGGLDRNTLAHRHEPVTVTYGLAMIHGRQWLVRTQIARDGLSNEPAWTELLCPDVTAFNCQPAGVAISAPLELTPDDTPNATIPPVVSVWIDGPSGRVMNETLVLK